MSMSKSTIQCFLLEPSDQGEKFLRRFVFSRNMPTTCLGSKSYHDHSEVIGRGPYPEPDSNGTYLRDFPDDDPRWPTHCACGYKFAPSDERQANIRRLFKRSDTGELVSIEHAPPGAMWYADWYPESYRGPDGHTLMVKTPAGDWLVDAPSDTAVGNKGGGWQRTGTAPNITAHPSIGMYGPDGKRWAYHGWLRNGTLVEC